MKKIAVEEHWWHASNDKILEELFERTNYPIYAYPENIARMHPKMLTEGFEEFRLKEMDKNGVAIQVLSNSFPGIQGINEAEEAINTAKAANNDMANLIKKYPGRFAGFASLPLQDPKAAADELERTVKKLGFKGALINGHTNGEYLDERKFWVVWECAEALGVPLYLHPFDTLSDQIKIYKGYNEMLGPTWSWNVETATHTMRIISSSLFDAFPEATLIIGHMGEMIPYILGRIDEGYRFTGGPKVWKIKRKPSYYVRENIMITTSGLWEKEALTCAISALGADKIMFATDYPYITTDEAVELIENMPISDDVKEKIYFKNARQLLKL